jgi:hypothetical protein
MDYSKSKKIGYLKFSYPIYKSIYQVPFLKNQSLKNPNFRTNLNVILIESISNAIPKKIICLKLQNKIAPTISYFTKKM